MHLPRELVISVIGLLFLIAVVIAAPPLIVGGPLLVLGVVLPAAAISWKPKPKGGQDDGG